MKEQEDISSFYFTIEETWRRYISYFAHPSLYSPDFDTFVRRLPSGTKPILRYVLDKCLNVRINEDWGNLELYHMKNNAAENNY